MRTKEFVTFNFMSRTRLVLALLFVLLGTTLLSARLAHAVFGRRSNAQQSSTTQSPTTRRGQTVGKGRKGGTTPTTKASADNNLAIITTNGSTDAAIILRRPDLNIPNPQQTPITGLPAHAHPFGIAFVDSDEALITNAGGSQIFLVRISTNSVIDTIDTAPNYDGKGTIVASPDTNFIFAVSGSKLLVKQSPVNSGIPGTVITLPGSVAPLQTGAIAFDDNGRAFVYNSAGISVLDSPYTSIAFTIPLANSNGSIAIAPDGNGLLVTDFTDTLKIFEAPFSADSIPTTLTLPGSPNLDGIVIDPDGNKALVSSASTSHLFTLSQPFDGNPSYQENGLPSNLATGAGFGDVAVSSDGMLAIGTGFATADSNAQAAFIEDPFHTSKTSEVMINNASRGSGSVRFMPEDIANGTSGIKPKAAPDLQITKSHSGVFVPGSNGVYTITVTNVGTAATTGTITVTDTLPNGLGFVSGAGATCAASVQIVTCTNATTLAVNATETITLTVAVGTGQSSVTNNVSVSTTGDTNATNDTASDPTDFITETWMGGDVTAPNDWSNSKNWNPAVVPTSTDNVLIPNVTSLPVLSTDAPVNDLIVATGASVNTNAHVLSCSGQVDATGGITGTGTIHLSGTNVTLKGTLPNVFITGTISSNGTTKANGSFTVESGEFTVNGQTVTISSDFKTNDSGVFDMENASDQLIIQGNAIIDGNTTKGLLTAGTMSVTGSFTENSSTSPLAFAPSGSHKVLLNGSASQSISFIHTTGSTFQNLVLNNAAGANFTSDAIINGDVTITSGNFTSNAVVTVSVGGNLTDSVGSRWKVTTTNFTGSPSLPATLTTNATFSGAAMLTNSFTLTGNLSVQNLFTMNGQTVTVVGNFSTDLAGILDMENVNDQLVVQGNISFLGNTTSAKMTAGLIKVTGNFTENSSVSPVAFGPSGSNKVQFNGTAAQTIALAHTASSGFENLEVNNTAGVNFASDTLINGSATITTGTATSSANIVVTIGGNLFDSNGGRWQVAATTFTGSPSLPTSFKTNAIFLGAAVLTNSFTITGNLSLQQDVKLNGQTVTVVGDFSTVNGGILDMQNSLDQLIVQGNVSFLGDTSISKMTAGLIKVTGSFTENSTVSPFAFAPSGTNKVQLNGTSAQTISFNHVASSAFQDLELNNSSGANFATTTLINGTVTITSGTFTSTAGTTTTIGGSLVDSVGNRWQAGNTTFSGSPSLPSTFTTTATFSGTATITNDFTVTGFTFVTGSFNLNGHKVTDVGDFTTHLGGTVTMQNTNDQLIVQGNLNILGDTTIGKLTAGVIKVTGNFTENSSVSPFAFAPSGTNRVQMNGISAQAITFNHVGASAFNDLEILNTSAAGIVLASNATLNGQLISNTGGRPILRGTGHTISMAGFNLNGLTIDDAPVISSAGTLTRLDNVTFQNFAQSDTQLTINHPGAATPFTFHNNQFLVTPTTGFFINATDTLNDSNVLTINMLDSVPTDGTAHTSTAGGAIVNWQLTVVTPDLALTKSHTGNFTVGTNGVYNLKVTNVGTGSTTGAVTITDTLPNGLTFVTATGNGSCTAVSQTVTCPVTGPLTAGAVANIAMTVSVGSAAAPGVTNTATVSTNGDTNAANDSSSDVTTVNISSDLALSFNVGPNPVTAGNNLTYTLGVTNNGPSPATGVTLTLPLPPNVSFLSAVSDQGSCTPGTAVICNIGNMIANSNVGVTIVVKANSGPFTTNVSITGNQPDPNPGNNSASTTIGVIQPPAVLTIAKTAPLTVAPGTNFSYTIAFGNTGGTDATGVTISDTLPTGVTFVSATSGGVFNSGLVTWNIGTVAKGSGGTVSFTVKPTITSGTVTNQTYSIQGSGLSPVAGLPVSTIITNNQAVLGSISPDLGPQSGGSAVVITGLNFLATGAGTPTVRFGTATATNVLVVSNTVITADSPAGTGTVPVTVTTGNGLSVGNLTFTYTTATLPLTVSQLNLSQGPEAGGTAIKIFGVGFLNSDPVQITSSRVGRAVPSNVTSPTVTTNVLFGGKPATNVVVVSDTEIDAVTPAGTGIVDVAISNDEGTSRLPGGFTYLKPFANDVQIQWRSPNDPTQTFAPPRDCTASVASSTTGDGTGRSSNYSSWLSGHISFITSTDSVGSSATPNTSNNQIIGYNLYRGFNDDFPVTNPLSDGVTRIANVPANQFTVTDSSAALAEVLNTGLGVPFYRVTALYQTPNGIVESAPSDAAGPALAITNVAVVAGTGSGRTIVITGAGFATFRAIVEINGVQITKVTFPAANRDENGTSNQLQIDDPTGNLIPVGALVKIDVLNPGLTVGSGQRSAIFDFRRPPN